MTQGSHSHSGFLHVLGMLWKPFPPSQLTHSRGIADRKEGGEEKGIGRECVICLATQGVNASLEIPVGVVEAFAFDRQ